MSRYSKTDQGELEYTRAATDEVEDACKKYGLHCDVMQEMTEQRGVWALLIAFSRPDARGAMIVATTYRNTWPNSVAVSFGAFLYQSCHKAVRMVEAWHADQERESAVR